MCKNQEAYSPPAPMMSVRANGTLVLNSDNFAEDDYRSETEATELRFSSPVCDNLAPMLEVDDAVDATALQSISEESSDEPKITQRHLKFARICQTKALTSEEKMAINNRFMDKKAKSKMRFEQKESCEMARRVCEPKLVSVLQSSMERSC